MVDHLNVDRYTVIGIVLIVAGVATAASAQGAGQALWWGIAVTACGAVVMLGATFPALQDRWRRGGRP